MRGPPLRRGAVLQSGGARERIAAACHVERARVRQVEGRRATTNPYHRAQYISAFIESRSAAMAHEHRSRGADTAGPRETLPALAAELRWRYGTRRAASAAPAPRRAAVPFGAWRRQTHALDVVHHRWLREARTPAELSPAALQRVVPAGWRPWRRWWAALQRPGDGAEALQTDFARLLARHAATETLGASPATRRAMIALTLQALTRRDGWRAGMDFTRWYLAEQLPRGTPAAPGHAEASQHLAVLGEAIRAARARHGVPPLAAMEALLTAVAADRPLLPVAAAPLLAVLEPPGAAGDLLRAASPVPGAARDPLERLVGRWLLPSLHRLDRREDDDDAAAGARAEWLRACFRFGAPAAVWRGLAEAAAPRTPAARRALSPVWFAYLFCGGEATGALRRSYRPREEGDGWVAAAETAALMEAELRAATETAADAALARADRLVQTHGSGPGYTVGVMANRIRAHHLRRDVGALRQLSVDLAGEGGGYGGWTGAEEVPIEIECLLREALRRAEAPVMTAELLAESL